MKKAKLLNCRFDFEYPKPNAPCHFHKNCWRGVYACADCWYRLLDEYKALRKTLGLRKSDMNEFMKHWNISQRLKESK